MLPLVEAELAFGTDFGSLVVAEVFRRHRDFVGHSCRPFGDSETFLPPTLFALLVAVASLAFTYNRFSAPLLIWLLARGT